MANSSLNRQAVLPMFGVEEGTKLLQWLDPCCSRFCNNVQGCISNALVQSALGLSPAGNPDLFLNQQGNFVTNDVNCSQVNSCLGIEPSGSVALALTQNGTWQSFSTAPYKIYAALLGYDGTNFTIQQLQNTIGDGSNDGIHDIAWDVLGAGVIRATMLISGPNTGPFTTGKTFILTSMIYNSPHFYTVIPTYYGSPFTAIVPFQLMRNDGNQSATPTFTNLAIEIRVYP